MNKLVEPFTFAVVETDRDNVTRDPSSVLTLLAGHRSIMYS
jgi:hypothetical protein